jgi:hypothetical protein
MCLNDCSFLFLWQQAVIENMSKLERIEVEMLSNRPDPGFQELKISQC